MVTRVFSAIIMFLIVAPLILIGGFFFFMAVYLLSLIAIKEFMAIKESKKQLPLFVKFISYIMITLYIFTIDYSGSLMTIDIRLLAGLFIVYLLPVIVYNDRKVYSINDAFYLIGGVFFLGFAFSIFILIRSISIDYLLFLLLITVVGDTYAYVTGRLIGKHKLLANISPKKTLEGALGGLIMAIIIGASFYVMVINPEIEMHVILIITTFLAILSQFGDLIFSSIKRYYGKKDYSDFIPGHGGVLDRVDSLLFVLIGYLFFIGIC